MNSLKRHWDSGTTWVVFSCDNPDCCGCRDCSISFHGNAMNSNHNWMGQPLSNIYGWQSGDYGTSASSSLSSHPHMGKPPYQQQSFTPVLDCRWYHGVRNKDLLPYVKYGILPKNRLKTLGIDKVNSHSSYHDSRSGLVYITSHFETANSFASSGFVLCMGAIKIERRDRNGDQGAVEVRKQIRPEYLRVHNYQKITGLCWPLLWVAKEENWQF